MVCESPDPPDSEDAFRVVNHEVIMGATDTDSDEDVNDYSGYQPLPLAPDDTEQSGSDEEDASDKGESCGSLPAIIPIEATLVREVWSSPQPSSGDIQMDSKKVSEVKAAMINFTLPSTSIPEWASSVPEDEWKDKLMKRLQSMKSDNSN